METGAFKPICIGLKVTLVLLFKNKICKSVNVCVINCHIGKNCKRNKADLCVTWVQKIVVYINVHRQVKPTKKGKAIVRKA